MCLFNQVSGLPVLVKEEDLANMQVRLFDRSMNHNATLRYTLILISFPIIKTKIYIGGWKSHLILALLGETGATCRKKAGEYIGKPSKNLRPKKLEF